MYTYIYNRSDDDRSTESIAFGSSAAPPQSRRKSLALAQGLARFCFMLLLLQLVLLLSLQYSSAVLTIQLSCPYCCVIVGGPCCSAAMPGGRPKKKAKTTTLPASLPYKSSGSTNEAATQNRNDAHNFSTAETPYGPVIQHKDLGPDQAPQEFAHPFALLWFLCAHSEDFFHFLKGNYSAQNGSAMEEGIPCGRICIYADETTPGNVHRPDKGRSFTGIYWTFLDFPNWYRSGSAG